MKPIYWILALLVLLILFAKSQAKKQLTASDGTPMNSDGVIQNTLNEPNSNGIVRANFVQAPPQPIVAVIQPKMSAPVAGVGTSNIYNP